MYFHRCGQTIKLKQKLEIVSGLTIYGGGINPSGSARFSKEHCKEQAIFCEVCGEIKEKEEIYSRCMECGETFGIDKLFTVSGSGGIYCKTCCDSAFEGSRKYNLGSVVDKILK